MHDAEATLNARVLAVDDEPFDLLLIDRYLSRSGFQVTRANSGAHALKILEQCRRDLPEAILLDRMMPEMSGIEVMEVLVADPDFRDIPVIMQTGLADPEQIAFGISRGARYYLAKPFTGDLLVSMVRAAVDDYRRMRELRDSTSEFSHSLKLITSAQYELRTLQEARMLASHLSQFFPQPGRAIFGIIELLVNGVEHGNLGLDYADKSKLLRSGSWEAEVARRLELPEFSARRVRVDLKKLPNCTRLRVTDEGNGFDWIPYLEIQPERVFDLHGRGIAMSRLTSFDTIEYRGRGNEVEVTVKCDTNKIAAQPLQAANENTPISAAA
jgi:CheY-like chemotaxis protein